MDFKSFYAGKIGRPYAPIYDYVSWTMGASLNASSSRNLLSIAVTAPPSKTEYFYGERFSKLGMVVTATFDDGSSNPVTGYRITPNVPLTTQSCVTFS